MILLIHDLRFASIYSQLQLIFDDIITTDEDVLVKDLNLSSWDIIWYLLKDSHQCHVPPITKAYSIFQDLLLHDVVVVQFSYHLFTPTISTISTWKDMLEKIHRISSWRSMKSFQTFSPMYLLITKVASNLFHFHIWVLFWVVIIQNLFCTSTQPSWVSSSV